MTNLINRDPPGRLSCIHAFLKSISYRFGENEFNGAEAKHIVNGVNNPIDFCTCAKEYDQATQLIKHQKKHCPFLRAESSRSFCYLVNSNILDTQKSKAVGEAIQALEALGLCSRSLTKLKRLKKAKLSENGLRLSKYQFCDRNTSDYYTNAILDYGPAVGLLHYLDIYDEEIVRHSEISKDMGRPNNNDTVILSDGTEIILEDGDTQDARTRTTGALQAWLTYTGLIRPTDTGFLDSYKDANNYFCCPANKLGYAKIYLNKKNIGNFFSKMPLVRRPLSYDFYVKGVGTRREYSQRRQNGTQLANVSLREFAPKVRNRRLLLMYAYAMATQKNKQLNLQSLAEESKYSKSPFVINADTHNIILVENEANFLNIAGAPFLRSKSKYEIIIPRIRLEVDNIVAENNELRSTLERIVTAQNVLI